MFFTSKDQVMYPAAWEYNCCRIMTALAAIVENEGGRVKYNDHSNGYIVNRSIRNQRIEVLDRIEHWQRCEGVKSEKRERAIARERETLKELDAIDNSPVKITQTSYIRFILNDTLYAIDLADNPFFPFHYRKTPINNNKYSQDAICNDLEKDWLWDCFFGMATNADIVEAANLIFNQIVNANMSAIRRDGKRVRVHNIYSSGYHYEFIAAPERIGTIDF